MSRPSEGNAPHEVTHLLRLRGERLLLEPGRPLLMGILNTNPDSVADAARPPTLASRLERAHELVAAGADIVDVGGDSGRTDRPPTSEAEEIARVVPVVERLAAEGVRASVDTWKPPVARAALDAGAVMVNDVSGLSSPELADLVAGAGAALVVMHTRAAPKERRFPAYADVAADVRGFLAERLSLARRRGVGDEQLVVDPGPDFAKTPDQTLEVLRRLGELHALGRPILLAVSRKYFVGVVTGHPPLQRLGGTLAAVQAGVARGAAILRVHDVAEVAAYLAVRRALKGEAPVGPDQSTDDRLRWLPAPD